MFERGKEKREFLCFTRHSLTSDIPFSHFLTFSSVDSLTRECGRLRGRGSSGDEASGTENYAAGT